VSEAADTTQIISSGFSGMAHSSGSYRLFKNFVLHIVWDMSNVAGREDMKKEKGVNLE